MFDSRIHKFARELGAAVEVLAGGIARIEVDVDPSVFDRRECLERAKDAGLAVIETGGGYDDESETCVFSLYVDATPNYYSFSHLHPSVARRWRGKRRK